MEGKPSAPRVMPGNIPAALRESASWVVWKYTPETDPETGEVTWDKPPYNARTGGLASSTNPATWATFEDAMSAYCRGEWDGVGFVLHRAPGEEGGLVGIDLDHCRDPETGALDGWAWEIVARLASYAEASPSGEGVRVFVLGDLPPHGRKKGDYENYQTGRYVTVTGARLPDSPEDVFERQADLLAVHLERFGPAPPPASQAKVNGHAHASVGDAELIARARESRSGAKFTRLWDGDADDYPSASEADLALVNYLAFWTGGDVERVDALFRQSNRYRTKWDEKRGTKTYGERTIEKAFANRTEFYSGPKQKAFHRNGTSPEQEESDGDATAADLIRINATIRWAWEGWIPFGVLTIIAAEPGCGKTRLCADLLRRVFLGLPWPDGSPASFPQGSVGLWVPADNQHPELASIPEQFGFPPEALYLNTARSAPFGGTMLDDAEDLKAFERRIVRLKPALVFVDTCLNATERSSHKPEDARAFFSPLQQIAARTSVPLICVTHLNAAGKPLGRRIEGQGRVVIMLEKPDPDGQPHRRRLYVRKSNSLFPEALGVTMGDHGNEYDRNPPKAPDVVDSGPEKMNATDRCMAIMTNLLIKGPMMLGVLRNTVLEQGFSIGAFQRAKAIMKLHEYKAEGRMWIELPS